MFHIQCVYFIYYQYNICKKKKSYRHIYKHYLFVTPVGTDNNILKYKYDDMSCFYNVTVLGL